MAATVLTVVNFSSDEKNEELLEEESDELGAPAISLTFPQGVGFAECVGFFDLELKQQQPELLVER